MKQKTKQKVKLKFEAKRGSRMSHKQAENYGRRIYELMKEKGKTTIKPREVLDDAKDKSAPYHDYFDWDDTSAGERYRLTQARHLISSIVIVRVRTEETEPIQVRAFVNIIDDEGIKGYVPIDVAISNPNSAPQIILQALKEAKLWREKYLEYKELAKIHKAIQEKSQEFNLEED